jgi:hypothetical protein
MQNSPGKPRPIAAEHRNPEDSAGTTSRTPPEVLLGLACRYCHRPFAATRCSPVEAGTVVSSHIYTRPWRFRVLACEVCGGVRS